MDVEVRRVDELLDLRRRLKDSALGGVDAIHRATKVIEELLEAAAIEVRRRREVLQRCCQDPEADCRGPAELLERAEAARARVAAAAANAFGQGTALRGRYEQCGADATAYLSMLHAHLQAAPEGAEAGFSFGGAGFSAAGGGGGAAGGGGGGGVAPGGGSGFGGGTAWVGEAGGPAEGALPADLPAELAEAVDAWVRKGDELDRRVWEAFSTKSPLSADDRVQCARLDAAINSTPPLSAPLTLTRSCTPKLLSSFGVSPSDSPEHIAGAISSGRAFHAGYVAASTADPFHDLSNHEVHLRVHVPAGAHVLDLRSACEGGLGKGHYTEHEILLPRDGYLVTRTSPVRAVRRFGKVHWYFDVDYEPPR